MPAVLLVAAAVGALTTAVVAVLRPNLPPRLPRHLTGIAAGVGAVAVGLADTAPTGSDSLDLVLRALFGLAVPVAAARAGSLPTAWLGIVATAALLLADAPAEALTGAATGALLALVAAGASTPPAAAVAAVAAVGPLSHTDWDAVTGDSAAALAVATVPVLLVGLVRAGRPARGRTTLALAVVVLLLGSGAVAGLLAALSARTDVDRAVDLATAGIDRLGDDDDRARAELLDAAGAFESAEDTLTTWWARSALLVPGVAQQTRAVTTMATAGADLARTAAHATEDADVDAIRPTGGRIDLDALAALEEPLERSVAALRRADRRLGSVDSPMLLGPVSDRLDDLRSRVVDARATAELTARAVDVAPQLLGGQGPRRWFVAIQNPAELTGNGGFMGNWAELTTDGGRMTLTRSGRFRDLSLGGPDPDGRSVDGVPELESLWGSRNTASWSTTNFSPDHPTVARAMSQLYPQSGGRPVDGVIALTPEALAGFLELTGPVELAGYPEPLSSENAVRILEHEQYVTFPEDVAGGDRRDFLQDAVESVFDRLTDGALPSPRVIARELGPAVTAGHLELWSPHAREQALFDAMGATGAASRDGADSVGVVTQNFNGNKIDWFLHRRISYDATWDPASGEVEATLRVQIENRSPATGLPSAVIGWGGDESLGQRPVADGENHMHVALYSTYPIDAVTVDGEPIEFTRREELGHRTARFFLSVPAGGTREVVASVSGRVDAGARYALRALRQPTANPDRWSVTVRPTGGWDLDPADATITDVPATERVEVAVKVARSEGTWWDRLRRGD